MKKKKTKYSIWQNIGFMVRTAWRTRKGVLWSCLVVVLINVIQNTLGLFITPEILKQIENGASLRALLGTILFYTVSLAILTALLRYFNQHSKTINTRSGRIDVRRRIREMINYKAGTTSYPNTKDPKIQKLLAAAKDATEDSSRPAEGIWNAMVYFVVNSAIFAVCLLLIQNLNLLLALVSVAITLVEFFAGIRMNLWAYYHREEEAAINRKVSYMRARSRSIPLAKDIRIFGLRGWFEDVYDRVLKTYSAFVNRREKAYMAVCVLNTGSMLLRHGIAYGYLIWRTVTDGLPASEFVLYFNAISVFNEALLGVMSNGNLLHRSSLEISKIQEYLNLPEQFRFEGGIPIPEAAAYEMKLENVSFRYPGSDTNIFSELNLTIHPGEKIAVVGLNGAGKTTLVNLLCGLYDPDKGRVLLNGTDIRSFNRNAYYALFSAVFQKYAVMDTTLLENVVCGEAADTDRVFRCLEYAGLGDFVKTLPKGLNTHIGREVHLDGVVLSGGQTQRLLLARALYKNGQILVLDEPTAALDPLAEHDIYTKYSQITDGKTALFISHRLASTRFCDRILLMEQGMISEMGTHEELLSKNGKYAEIFRIQSRYYQEGGKANEEG